MTRYVRLGEADTAAAHKSRSTRRPLPRRAITVETADTTWRVNHDDELLAELAHTTPIARFKVRKLEPRAGPTADNDQMHLDGELWHLLHALDDPDNLEFPAGYDHRRTRSRFEQLAQRLNADFDCECRVDRDVQDASLHGRIDIPAPAGATGKPLVISVSNFGGLAVLSVDNPGAWSDAEAADLLRPDDAHRVHTALTDLRYILVPEEPLWTSYDGFCDAGIIVPATWWIRYFDYI